MTATTTAPLASPSSAAAIDRLPTLAYDVAPGVLGRRYADRIVTLAADEDTRRFVRVESARRHSRWRSVSRGVARALMSSFSADALCRTHSLFMLSTAQWECLLGERSDCRLLDVGAAAGHVTARLAPLFADVVATDVSRPMVRRLRRTGVFGLHLDLSTTAAPGGPFDTVTLLNVLDRCARPVSLLQAAIDAVAEDGRLVVSIPLPYDPCWYSGPTLRDPLERLPIGGATWEAAAVSLAELLESRGLTIDTITRAPYLSGGDRREPLYVLDAAVIVASRHG